MALVQAPPACRLGGRSDGAYRCHGRFAAALGAGPAGRSNSIAANIKAESVSTGRQANAPLTQAIAHDGRGGDPPRRHHVPLSASEVRRLSTLPKGDGEARAHAAWSCAAGLGTSVGQATPTGHFAANHDMTVSYFRAVKDTSPCRRSKNLQSPAAMRPTVTISRLRAAANAAAVSSR